MKLVSVLHNGQTQIGAVVGDSVVIASGNIVYDQLSRACHYHPYELQPTRSEVEDWIGMVARFHDALVDHAMRQPPR